MVVADTAGCSEVDGARLHGPHGNRLPRRLTRRRKSPDDVSEHRGTMKEALPPRRQHPAVTIRTVVMMTRTTLYVCDTSAPAYFFLLFALRFFRWRLVISL
ncbi:hypothetical protein TraAM80_01728 [Trypanosoma rangeli]|uniref:Uncharacterized protein n=1 Tax=Trypanosoma rangeli TaxID=5698 RepID=A0A3R7NZC9_TRYRA|nr:uncharacterized protein TraAM80_01728 [Trypanosoma rangeli]RNF10152.1 hypothetical protein TraAM80_01728 [Trypanosoma rangeli]|eukprot:RNF10152.1 hypothetical protein TraAM80_01728 [Trypanosoma rangeli]